PLCTRFSRRPRRAQTCARPRAYWRTGPHLHAGRYPLQNRSALSSQREWQARWLRLCRCYNEQHRGLRAQGFEITRSANSISSRLLRRMGGPISISARSEGTSQDCHSVHASDHLCPHLHQHALCGENRIVLLAVPFSLVGAFWLLWLLG